MMLMPNGSGVCERGDARGVDLPLVSNAKSIPWSSRKVSSLILGSPGVVVSFFSSSGSETLISLLTVPNDDSGILSVVPIALFISEAVRATGSLLLSYAGGDTACLVGTTHSYSAWAALQHGISAVFALTTWQFAAEGVDEIRHYWFHVARVHDHSPLPVTFLEYSSLPRRLSTGNFNTSMWTT